MSDENILTPEEKEDLIDELIEKAMSGENWESERLNTFAEYRASLIIRNQLKRICRVFKKLAGYHWKEYKLNVNCFTDNPNVLLDYSKMKHCQNYYGKNLQAVQKSIRDFEKYMFLEGKLFSVLLGYQREQ